MDFEFTAEQQALRESTARWLARAYPFTRRRQIAAAGGFDRGAYAELAALGLTALRAPTAHGGLGLGPIEAMVAMEELGRGLVLEPVGQTAWMATQVVAAQGDAELQHQWLPRLATGAAIMTLAHEEGTERYTSVVRTQAQPCGAAFTVTGTKHVVPVGDCADAYLVSARLPGSVAEADLFLVERNGPGVTVVPQWGADDARLAQVILEAAPARLLTSANGGDLLDMAKSVAIAALCAEAVGAMDALFGMTVEHVRSRKQFGVALSTFQALRHRMADCKVALELARSMSYYAHLLLQEGSCDLRKGLSQAKVQVGQSARFIGEQSTQLHGGIGLTTEHAGSHYFRRLTCIDLSFGDATHHLERVACAMDLTAGVVP